MADLQKQYTASQEFLERRDALESELQMLRATVEKQTKEYEQRIR